MVSTLRADGHPIERVDLGGGLGIPYDEHTPPTPAEYGDMVRAAIGDLDCRLLLEPGRLITGNAGVLVTRVLYVKESGPRTFVIVDAAMNDLARPALYDAYHEIVPVIEPSADAVPVPVDVVGPICESSDSFATERALSPVAPGDLLAIRSAGAYGAVMSSTYNSRPLVPEVLVRGPSFSVVRRRVDIEDMLAHEVLPPWLSVPAGAFREAGE